MWVWGQTKLESDTVFLKKIFFKVVFWPTTIYNDTDYWKEISVCWMYVMPALTCVRSVPLCRAGNQRRIPSVLLYLSQSYPWRKSSHWTLNRFSAKSLSPRVTDPAPWFESASSCLFRKGFYMYYAVSPTPSNYFNMNSSYFIHHLLLLRWFHIESW